MIHFDHNASTPLHPEVRAALQRRWSSEAPGGNPSSVHALGRAAREIVERARRQIASAVGAEPLEITFTSGGTEADNLAVFGSVRALRAAGRPSGVLCSPLEHPAVREAVLALQREGTRVQWLEVDAHGRLEPSAVAGAVNPEIGLLTVACANHELGVRYDLPAVVAAVRAIRPDLVVHTDAVQALGKIELDFAGWGVDLMSLSGHKIGAPAGVGALVHRKSLRLAPLLSGGHQERGRRVGTENLLGVEAFGVAAELAAQELPHRRARWSVLHDRLVAGVRALGGRVHGCPDDPAGHVGNTVNFAFEGCEGDLLCMSLDLEGIAVSTGAACSAGTLEPSTVLLGLGLPPARAREAVRVSFGPTSTADEVDRLLAVLPRLVRRIRDEGREEEAAS